VCRIKTRILFPSCWACCVQLRLTCPLWFPFVMGFLNLIFYKQNVSVILTWTNIIQIIFSLVQFFSYQSFRLGFQKMSKSMSYDSEMFFLMKWFGRPFVVSRCSFVIVKMGRVVPSLHAGGQNNYYYIFSLKLGWKEKLLTLSKNRLWEHIFFNNPLSHEWSLIMPHYRVA